jgi:hypothetical protein
MQCNVTLTKTLENAQFEFTGLGAERGKVLFPKHITRTL